MANTGGGHRGAQSRGILKQTRTFQSKDSSTFLTPKGKAFGPSQKEDFDVTGAPTCASRSPGKAVWRLDSLSSGTSPSESRWTAVSSGTSPLESRARRSLFATHQSDILENVWLSPVLGLVIYNCTNNLLISLISMLGDGNHVIFINIY